MHRLDPVRRFYMTRRFFGSACAGFAVAAFAGTVFAGPPGDDCGAPVTLFGNSISGVATPATTTDGPSETLCNNAGDSQVARDIWISWTAPCAGPVTVSLCDASFDTKLAVYTSC